MTNSKAAWPTESSRADLLERAPRGRGSPDCATRSTTKSLRPPRLNPHGAGWRPVLRLGWRRGDVRGPAGFRVMPLGWTRWTLPERQAWLFTSAWGLSARETCLCERPQNQRGHLISEPNGRAYRLGRGFGRSGPRTARRAG